MNVRPVSLALLLIFGGPPAVAIAAEAPTNSSVAAPDRIMGISTSTYHRNMSSLISFLEAKK